jgi:hypothetical protein
MPANPLKLLALAAAIAAAAPGQAFTLTQCASSVPAPLGSSACGPNPLVYTVANGYFRSYSLFGFTGNIEVVSIAFGVQQVVANQPGGFPMSIRLFADPTPGTVAPYAGLQFRHQENFTLPTISTPTVITRTMSGSPPVFTPAETLVVEVFANDGTYSVSKFLIGQNSLGQNGPGFIRAPACASAPNLSDVTDLASVGFGSMHIIIDVNGIVSQPPTYPGTNEDLVLSSAINANPLTSGTANEVKTANANDSVTVQFVSPNLGFALREMALIAQPFTTGFPPFPPAAPNIHMQFPGLFFLIGGVASPLGPPLLPPGGASISFIVPGGLSGNSVVFQGVAITLSPPFALNGLYASTNGHEIKLL